MIHTTISSPESELLDNLSDGQWHTTQKAYRHSGKHFGKNLEALEASLSSLASKGYLIPGQNKSYRFSPTFLEGWRSYRGIQKSGKKDLTSPRYFGGILEDEGWLLAPLRTHDLVHFRAEGNITVSEIQRRIGIQGIVRQDTDGLVRITSLDGESIYNIVKSWEPEEGIGISGVRLDKDVRRRELLDLPPRFIAELCEFYGTFAHTLLRKSMTSVRKHISDPDDIQQQIYIWIIDAVQRYDEQSSVPFAAYLHSSLQRWVHDLNRKSYGRAAADSELKYSRAISNFVTKHDRNPTDEELANELGESVATVREKLLAISRVNNLRSMSPLTQDDYEIPIRSDDDQERDFHEEVEQTLLSAALTSSALGDGRAPQVTSWLKVYDETWGKGRNSRLKKVDNKELLLSMRSKVKDILG